MDGFREWVVEHHGMVWAVCFAVLRDRPTADEVTQDTFLLAYQRRDQLADAERAGAWLRALARNQAVDRLRRRRMDARARVSSVEASAPVTPTSGPEAAIAEALERLDDDSRALLLQFHLEGRTSQELADQWGVSDATLRKRLSRARATLRDEYRAELKRWASPPRDAATVALAVLAALPRPSRAAPWLAVAVVATGLVALFVTASSIGGPTAETDDRPPSAPGAGALAAVTTPEPEAHPPGYVSTPDAPDVQCELSYPASYAAVQELDPDTGESLGWVSTRMDGPWAIFEPRNAMGMGWLKAEGFEAEAVVWYGGACTAPVQLTPGPHADIELSVEGDPERVVVLQLVCPGRVRHFPPHRDHVIAPLDGEVPEDCFFRNIYELDERGFQEDHPLPGLRPGDRRELTLFTTAPPPMGWRLRHGSGEVWVASVVAGLPADEAGIEALDVLVAIDGEPVTDDALANVATPTEVTVRRGGEELQIEIPVPRPE